MRKDPRQILNEFLEGIEDFSQKQPAATEAFMNLLGTNYSEGALDVKTKEIISVGIGVYNRCEYCIVFHTYKALEAGATKEEIYEAAMVAVAFGGGPSMAYSVSLLKDAVETFAPDFGK